MKITLKIACAFSVLIFGLPAAGLAQPLGTAFTYQGQLKDSGSPAQGSFTMVFRLFDAATLGNPVGPTLTFDGTGGNPPAVAVANGLFTVRLDFGGTAFNGDSRWLQITVDGTTLTPRQEVTAAPYALKSKAALALDAPDGNPLNAVLVDSAGNVGIGIANPTERLSVRDRIGVYEGTSGGAEIRFDDGVAFPNGLFRLRQSGDIFRLEKNTSVAGDFGSFNTVLAANGGNLGIGTLAPAERLDIGGHADGTTLRIGDYTAIGESFSSAATIVGDNVKPADAADAMSFMESHASYGGRAIEMHLDKGITFHALSGTVTADNAFASEKMRITNFGNVGIGTVTPSAALHVKRDQASSSPLLALENLNSDSAAGAFMTFSAAGHPAATLGLTSTNATDDAFKISSGSIPLRFQSLSENHLGLGSLGAILNVYNSDDSTIDVSIKGGGSGVEGDAGAIIMRSANGATETVEIVGDESHGAGAITLRRSNGSAAIVLDGEHTDGNSRITTQVLEITGGADFSEQFDVAPGNVRRGHGATGPEAEIDPEPGMVVSIDTDNPGKLMVSTSAYDRTVAGVISGAGGVMPGFLMGQRDSVADGEHPVALSGRVYVRCDAGSGAIQPGDMLTTSDTAGHAMKVSDHGAAQGAIIGKAMTRLENGRGLVLVLVSLQ